MTLVSLGLRLSLPAAAWRMEALPVTLAALYDKVNRTKPGTLHALVRGSAERLALVAAAVDGGTTLPGWHLRVLDGSHVPASEKRLAPLREHRGAALPGFAVAVLAHNVLALLQRCVEQAHQGQEPPPEVSTYHLALHIRSGYEGMLIALPPEQWRSYDGDPTGLADQLLQLARNIDPRQFATSKRSPKVAKPKGTSMAPSRVPRCPPHGCSPMCGQQHLERGGS